MRPTSEELNKKIWYRVFKVAAGLVFIGAFIGPWVIHEPNPLLFIDGIVSALIWAILFFVIQRMILYIIYGKQERTPEERKRIWEWLAWGVASCILVGGFLTWVISGFYYWQ